MNTGRNPWDNDYQRRGRLWGGSAIALPRLAPSSRILELGCGNGKTVSSLVQSGCTVTAVDFSSQAALLCRNSCTDPEKVRILIADSRKTPFRDESFDVVCAFHIMGHLDRDGRCELAKEIFRLLVPGGMMYFRDFSVNDFRCGIGEETEAGTYTRKNGISTHYFTDDETPTIFPGLTVQSLVQRGWVMRVRGTVLQRAEVVAEFKKVV